MSEEEKSTVQISEKILSEEQQIVLQNIARLGKGLTNQRAKALLALDEGSTRAGAGEQSGLSLGQIKYLLATFRQTGLAMFARYSSSESFSQRADVEHEVVAKEEDQAEKAIVTKKGKKEKKKPTKKGKPRGKEKKMAKKGKKTKKKGKVKAKGKEAKTKKGKKGKAKGGKKKSKK